MRMAKLNLYTIYNLTLKNDGYKQTGARKLLIITHIRKQGNHELPNHNRPISLLPVLSRVCERVGYAKQNGSKKSHSTETSLLHTTDAFLKRIDNKKLTACVLLDMSKASNTVFTERRC